MEEEVRRHLRKQLELIEENNKLLKRMQRAAMWGIIFRVLWWAILLGLPFIIYLYFIEPYAGGIIETYTGFKGGVDSATQVTDNLPPFLQKLLGNTSGQ
jgi:hypothetical protein|tara:strand:+ start:13331 stop:13627 length:297 start_codon:yes stop_codon:yes gene_type:complete